jgi:hypothetical protein
LDNQATVTPAAAISPNFKKILSRYVNYRGIDIVLHLKDGTIIELDKNRRLDGDVVIKNGKEGVVARIELSEIQKADFFAA